MKLEQISFENCKKGKDYIFYLKSKLEKPLFVIGSLAESEYYQSEVIHINRGGSVLIKEIDKIFNIIMEENDQWKIWNNR